MSIDWDSAGWDYAALSKAAKAAGGPEMLADALAAAGETNGRIKMIPWLFVAAIGGYGISKLVDLFKAKKATSQKAVDEAKANLVNAIKKYDEEHPETEPTQSEENAPGENT